MRVFSSHAHHSPKVILHLIISQMAQNGMLIIFTIKACHFANISRQNISTLMHRVGTLQNAITNHRWYFPLIVRVMETSCKMHEAWCQNASGSACSIAPWQQFWRP